MSVHTRLCQPDFDPELWLSVAPYGGLFPSTFLKKQLHLPVGTIKMQFLI